MIGGPSGHERTNTPVFVFREVARLNLTEAKRFKPWEHWRICHVAYFRATKLVGATRL